MAPETLILPTEIEDCVDREIRPGVWLMTNPRYQPTIRKWTALANVGGALAVVQLRVYISEAHSNATEG
jgi:hypothetical protein